MSAVPSTNERHMTTERRRAEMQAWDEVAERTLDESVLADVARQWGPFYDVVLDAVEPKGKRILDGGCGEGILARRAADRGGDVVAFDLSPGMVRSAADLGRPGEPVVRYACSAFEELPFPDATFDAAIGMFVLHHVDLAPAARELARVLKPGARASFVETWQRNPLIRAGRKLRGRFGVAMYGTPDESPLLASDLDTLRAAGFDVRMEYPHFVFFKLVANNLLKRRPAARPLTLLLDWADETLTKVRAVRPYTYYAIVHLRRR